MRRALPAMLALALVAAVVVGLSQTGTTNKKPAPARVENPLQRLAGAPAPLAALHRQSNAILGGGTVAIKRRLAALKGYPVVLNKWASWCGPCRFEFPFFQRAAVDYGRRVAFLGLNAGDNREHAQKFLKRFPIPFPSYEDPNERAASALGIAANYPMTMFYDADGDVAYIHQGGYATLELLVKDIERYLLS